MKMAQYIEILSLLNIMRHRKGRLYLLDFGAVRQVTSAAAAGGPPGRSTGIYSMGFAPPEQMSGSQVYPYNRLVCSGSNGDYVADRKEAADLYDSYNNHWNWRNYTQVSDTLADVLDRMLLPNTQSSVFSRLRRCLTPSHHNQYYRHGDQQQHRHLSKRLPLPPLYRLVLNSLLSTASAASRSWLDRF
jgi:serine/threonine protein kinase